MKTIFIRLHYLALMLLVTLLVAACASPTTKLEKLALSKGMEKVVLIANSDIPLLAYQWSPNHHTKQALTYVYLEGDGIPWDKGYWPAANPNTRHSVALPLLQLGKRNSLYLARPCYGWQTMPLKCQPRLWTSGRYSQQVVDNLNRGLNEYTQNHSKSLRPSHRYILVGHSGGGTLAMLIAAQRDDVAAVVTLGANLDHKAWTRHFGYLPLSASLNPAEQPLLPQQVLRWHLIGEADTVVPPKLIQDTLRRDTLAQARLYPQFNHHCCWDSIWAGILIELEQSLGKNNSQ